MPYKIVRHYSRDPSANRTIVCGLTLDEAREHCRDAETSSKTCTSHTACELTERMGPWFDAYEVD